MSNGFREQIASQQKTITALPLQGLSERENSYSQTGIMVCGQISLSSSFAVKAPVYMALNGMDIFLGYTDCSGGIGSNGSRLFPFEYPSVLL